MDRNHNQSYHIYTWEPIDRRQSVSIASTIKVEDGYRKCQSKHVRLSRIPYQVHVSSSHLRQVVHVSSLWLHTWHLRFTRTYWLHHLHIEIWNTTRTVLLDSMVLGLYKQKVYEMSRLNVEYTVLSKRRFVTLVTIDTVRGWYNLRATIHNQCTYLNFNVRFLILKRNTCLFLWKV